MPRCEPQYPCTISTLAALVAAVILVAWPVTGVAWGEEGHEIVGLIAAHYLDPPVRSRVADLLAGDASGLTATDLADESVWADRYRDSDRDTTRHRYLQTRDWHFINIEVAAPDLDAACFGHPRLTDGEPASEGPATDCIVDKIEQFRAELQAADTPPAERRLALQFLLHLMGDLHQPLHAADRHDRGGNDLHVASPSHPAGSLHHYWDTVFVADLGSDAGVVAARLIADLPDARRRAYAEGSPTEWARESFTVATHGAYGPVPSPPGPYPRGGVIKLDQAYSAEADRLVAVQLQRAGVRLARVLNEALR